MKYVTPATVSKHDNFTRIGTHCGRVVESRMYGPTVVNIATLRTVGNEQNEYLSLLHRQDNPQSNGTLCKEGDTLMIVYLPNVEGVVTQGLVVMSRDGSFISNDDYYAMLHLEAGH